MKEIEEYISAYFGIGGRDLSPVADLFQNRTLSRQEYLVKEGRYVRSMSFLTAGYLRIYAWDADGDKEITQWISSPGMFVTELSSFLFDTPSRFNIQALSDCSLYTISRDDYNRIGEFVPNWPQLDKLFIAKCFITLENRVFGQLSMSSEQKVLDLMQTNSDIFNQVPLQYIASMLGMTPETLSRVRKKLSS